MTEEERPLVLYIEDDEVNARLIGKVLAHRPNVVFDWVPTAEAGIERVRDEQPTLVFMDINLPGMNGYEALAHLRQDHQTEAIPVVALTSNAMRGDAEHGLRWGFDAYVTKPIDVVDILALVDQFIPDAALGPAGGS